MAIRLVYIKAGHINWSLYLNTFWVQPECFDFFSLFQILHKQSNRCNRDMFRFCNANTENHRKTRFAERKKSEEFDVSIPHTDHILGLFAQTSYLQSIYKLYRRNEFCVKLGDRFRMWPWIRIIIMFHLTNVCCVAIEESIAHFFCYKLIRR